MHHGLRGMDAPACGNQAGRHVRQLIMSAAIRCVRFNNSRLFQDDGNTSIKLKRNFLNLIYPKIKILTRGAYAPYASCMSTPQSASE